MPRKKKPKEQYLPNFVQSEDEISDLDSFCSEVKHPEINFERWHACHSDLNLCIPIFLSKSEIIQGFEKTVAFSRSITDATGRLRRERVSMTIPIPLDAIDGHMILIREQGDRIGSLSGDLIITLKIK